MNAIFQYRVSDNIPIPSMATPVTVIAESQIDAERKINDLWGHAPEYSTLISIKETE